jgi:hypothetical protein
MNALIYSLVTPPVLHMVVMEPMYVRSEYYHWVNRMSRNKVQEFVFTELNVWNPETVKYIEDWKKKYRTPKESSKS